VFNHRRDVMQLLRGSTPAQCRIVQAVCGWLLPRAVPGKVSPGQVRYKLFDAA